jgi:hypothetical protein
MPRREPVTLRTCARSAVGIPAATHNRCLDPVLCTRVRCFIAPITPEATSKLVRIIVVSCVTNAHRFGPAVSSATSREWHGNHNSNLM